MTVARIDAVDRHHRGVPSPHLAGKQLESPRSMN